MNAQKTKSDQRVVATRRLDAAVVAAMTIAPLDLEDEPTAGEVEAHLKALFRIARSVENFAKNGDTNPQLDWD